MRSWLQSVGSIGIFFCGWILGPLIALVGCLVYSELVAMFPKRSGGEVVYLVIESTPPLYKSEEFVTHRLDDP